MVAVPVYNETADTYIQQRNDHIKFTRARISHAFSTRYFLYVSHMYVCYSLRAPAWPKTRILSHIGILLWVHEQAYSVQRKGPARQLRFLNGVGR